MSILYHRLTQNPTGILGNPMTLGMNYKETRGRWKGRCIAQEHNDESSNLAVVERLDGLVRWLDEGMRELWGWGWPGQFRQVWKQQVNWKRIGTGTTRIQINTHTEWQHHSWQVVLEAEPQCQSPNQSILNPKLATAVLEKVEKIGKRRGKLGMFSRQFPNIRFPILPPTIIIIS